jgi:hypothetical protein
VPDLLDELYGGYVATWTQAICGACYAVRYPGRRPVRVSPGQPISGGGGGPTISLEHEQCCDCGLATTDGIYIRDDPVAVRYPRMVRKED